MKNFLLIFMLMTSVCSSYAQNSAFQEMFAAPELTANLQIGSSVSSQNGLEGVLLLGGLYTTETLRADAELGLLDDRFSLMAKGQALLPLKSVWGFQLMTGTTVQIHPDFANVALLDVGVAIGRGIDTQELIFVTISMLPITGVNLNAGVRYTFLGFIDSEVGFTLGKQFSFMPNEMFFTQFNAKARAYLPWYNLGALVGFQLTTSSSEKHPKTDNVSGVLSIGVQYTF